MKWISFIFMSLLFLKVYAQDNILLSYTCTELSCHQLKGSVAEMRQFTSASTQQDLSALKMLQLSGLDSTKELSLKFDSTGKMIQKSEKPLAADTKKNDVNTESIYRYANGQLITRISRQDGSLSNSVVFDYDRKNRISSYTVYDNKARLQFKYTFTYNSHQQLITIRRKNEENFPVEMIKLKYDNEGILSQQQFFDDNMKKIKVIEFNSQLSDSTGYYNNTVLTYNDSGKLLYGTMAVKTPEGFLLEKSIIDSAKKVTHYHKLHYNKQHDIEEEKLFANMEDITINYTYKYDDHGNWIEKVTIINDNPSMITTRAFEYFQITRSAEY